MRRLGKLSRILALAFLVSSQMAAGARPQPVSGSGSKAGVSEAEKSKALLLRQTGVLSGDFDVYVGDTFVYAVNMRSGLTVVARAPAWRVFVFSKRSGKIYSCPFEHFKLDGSLVNGLGMLGLPKLETIEFGRKHKLKILGCDATEYETTASYEADQIKAQQQNLISKVSPKYACLSVFEGHVYPRAVPEIVGGLHGVSSKYGLPLQMKYKTMNGGWHYPLQSMPVKYESLSQSLLLVPKGLQNARTINEVMLDQTGQEGMKQMLQSISPDLKGSP